MNNLNLDLAVSVCVASSEKEVFELLNGEPWLLAARDGFGNSLLDLVALRAPVNRLQFLLECGCSMNCLDSEGLGFVHILSSQKTPDLEKLAWYLKNDGKNLRSSLGWGVMHFAAETGGESSISLMVECGCDINERVGRATDGRTPLMIAAGAANLECFSMLLELGVDVDMRDAKNRSVEDFIGCFQWKMKRRLSKHAGLGRGFGVGVGEKNKD